MTNARSLANFATGIGTEGAVLTVDNTNNRIGIATTNPQNDLQVGLGITMEGDTGQVTFVGIVTAEGFRNSDGSVVGAASTDNINTSTLAQFAGGVGIADSIFHIGDDNTAIRFPAADTFTVTTAGSERLRIDSSGNAKFVSNARQIILRNDGTAGQPKIDFRNAADSGDAFAFINGATIDLQTGGSTRLHVDSSGNIGIGTDNPGTVLDVRAGDWANGDIVVGEKDNAGRIKFARGADGSDSGSIGFAAADNNNQLNINVASADGVISFDTNTNEALRIDSSQRLLIGTESSQDKWNNSSGDHHLVQIESTTAFSQSWISHSTSSTAGVQLDIGRSRGSADGDTTVVNNGDLLGHLCFQGADGSQFVRGARISATVNGTPGADDMPTDLVFETNSGSSNSAENARITGFGSFGIGSNDPGSMLQIDYDEGNSIVGLRLRAFNASGSKTWQLSEINGAPGVFTIRNATNGTNALSINHDGDATFNGITTATQFDATSDVTLKENIAVIDEPISKLSELKGVTFDWKKGGHSVGVIAQDVEKVLPTAVGGSKDQKTVNYNAIIGLLVESVKDQQKQIEELKSLLDK